MNENQAQENHVVEFCMFGFRDERLDGYCLTGIVAKCGQDIWTHYLSDIDSIGLPTIFNRVVCGLGPGIVRIWDQKGKGYDDLDSFLSKECFEGHGSLYRTNVQQVPIYGLEKTVVEFKKFIEMHFCNHAENAKDYRWRQVPNAEEPDPRALLRTN